MLFIEKFNFILQFIDNRDYRKAKLTFTDGVETKVVIQRGAKYAIQQDAGEEGRTVDPRVSAMGGQMLSVVGAYSNIDQFNEFGANVVNQYATANSLPLPTLTADTFWGLASDPTFGGYFGDLFGLTFMQTMNNDYVKFSDLNGNKNRKMLEVVSPQMGGVTAIVELMPIAQ